jgi:aspartyl-tRNA(Asn)/glutamyl-tRNA(Gln) amidotransferase subunit A
MQGPDPDDPVATTRAPEPALPDIERGASDLRLAIAGGYFAKHGDPDCFAALAKATRALGVTRTIELPEAARARAAAYVITAAEGAALHLDCLRERARDFDPAVRDRLIAGSAIPAAWVIKAQRFRRWYRERVLQLFDDVDVILAPTTPCRAPKIGQTTFVLDGVTMLVRPNIGIFTQPISFIGLPVVAIPIWIDAGLPLGVQVIAAPWKEADALRVARVLEQSGIAAARVPSL